MFVKGWQNGRNEDGLVQGVCCWPEPTSAEPCVEFLLRDQTKNYRVTTLSFRFDGTNPRMSLIYEPPNLGIVQFFVKPLQGSKEIRFVPKDSCSHVYVLSGKYK